MLRGIDISHHQQGINIGALDIDFVIIKATEGNGYKDDMCDSFVEQSKASGKKIGLYHFARPDLGNTAVSEADWFIKETREYQKEAIFVLDWESGNLGNVAWAKAWLDRVYEVTGIKPLIYMSESPANSYDWSSVANADYGVWIAEYGVNNGLANGSPIAKNWPFITLWQYTSVGRINGYDGNLDLDYFYGDRKAWDKYALADSTSQENNNGDQILYKGSKVKFNGIFTVDEINIKSNLFASKDLTGGITKNYHWFSSTPFTHVNDKGEVLPSQIIKKGSKVINNNIYEVLAVDVATDSAKLNINGRKNWVKSSVLYEISDQ